MLDPLAVFLGNTINDRGLTPIQLISSDHEVALASGLAVVTTHRLFRNSESANIEAVLTFPVPVHATLFDLTAETDGRLLHAKAQARSKAREVYEDAVTRGKSAVLHEELLKGIHMICVANIQPGGEIKVTTKWAMPLSDLPPSGWSKIYVILDTEGKDECHSRNTRRRRLSASCVRRRLCWRREGRQRTLAAGYRSASRPITAGARNMAV